MKNKNLIILIVVLLIILVFGFFMYKQVSKKVAMPSGKEQIDEKMASLPKLECNYSDDQAAYKSVIASKEVSQCECIKDAQMKDLCKSVLADVMLYDQALAQLDLSLCEKISRQTQKDACEKAVRGLIAQLEQEDPQHLADIYARNHNEKAIEQLEKVTTEDQTNVDNLVALATAYAEKGIKEKEQGRDQIPYVEKALGAIEKAKAIDGNNASVYRAEAYVNEVKPDYNAALELYTKAIDMGTEDVLAYAGRGHAHRMLGILEAAVDDFKKAAELDAQRDHVFIYTNLCNLEYSRGANKEAIENCKIVTEKKKVDPVFQSGAHQTLAMLYADKGDYAQANNHLLIAKTITPNDPNLYVNLAKLNIFEKKYADSESNARQAVELSPTKAASQLALARALYMQEKYDESIQVAQKGIELIEGDISLLRPSKPVVGRDLNYLIAHNYRQMGDAQRQSEYEKKAEDYFNQPLN